ncbi:hypothetical protein MJD09_11890, partial [bacterium]|nr:hypothetical protein [bacterium]
MTTIQLRCLKLGRFCHSPRAFFPPGPTAIMATFRHRTRRLPRLPESSKTFDLLIAGAGLAGLTAAHMAAK